MHSIVELTVGPTDAQRLAWGPETTSSVSAGWHSPNGESTDEPAIVLSSLASLLNFILRPIYALQSHSCDILTATMRAFPILLSLIAATLCHAQTKSNGHTVNGIERLLYISNKTGVSIYDINDGHKFLRKFDVPDSGDYKGISASISDRKSTRLNSSHLRLSRMPSSA